jgi:hypothetical protein
LLPHRHRVTGTPMLVSDDPSGKGWQSIEFGPVCTDLGVVKSPELN